MKEPSNGVEAEARVGLALEESEERLLPGGCPMPRPDRRRKVTAALIRPRRSTTRAQWGELRRPKS